MVNGTIGPDTHDVGAKGIGYVRSYSDRLCVSVIPFLDTIRGYSHSSPPKFGILTSNSWILSIFYCSLGRLPFTFFWDFSVSLNCTFLEPKFTPYTARAGTEGWLVVYTLLCGTTCYYWIVYGRLA